MRLTDLEAVFRSLKSELGRRPIYHWKPQRAEAHLFVTVLAYQLVQVIRTRLQAHGERASWETLRERLAGQQQRSGAKTGECCRCAKRRRPSRASWRFTTSWA